MSDQEDRLEALRAKTARDVAQVITESNARWPMMLELYAQVARERRAKYLALIKEDFTEAQALQLCVTM